MLKTILIFLVALLAVILITVGVKAYEVSNKGSSEGCIDMSEDNSFQDLSKDEIPLNSYSDFLQDHEEFDRIIGILANRYRGAMIDTLVVLDANAMALGSALAKELKTGFVMIRKVGMLSDEMNPFTDCSDKALEIAVESIQRGERVLIMDDVFATGATVESAATLVELLGGEVIEIACLKEIPTHYARADLKWPVFSLLTID